MLRHGCLLPIGLILLRERLLLQQLHELLLLRELQLPELLLLYKRLLHELLRLHKRLLPRLLRELLLLLDLLLPQLLPLAHCAELRQKQCLLLRETRGGHNPRHCICGITLGTRQLF